MRSMSRQLPKRGSISRYVIGANPRSPDDGNGGRMCTPPKSPANGPSSSCVIAGRSPPSESGYVSSCGPRRMAGAESATDRSCQGPTQGLGQGSSSRVTVATHLVRKVGEADAAVGVGERELPAGAGVPEAGRAEHRLGGRRGNLEAGPPPRAVVRQTRQLGAGGLL